MYHWKELILRIFDQFWFHRNTDSFSVFSMGGTLSTSKTGGLRIKQTWFYINEYQQWVITGFQKPPGLFLSYRSRVDFGRDSRDVPVGSNRSRPSKISRDRFGPGGMFFIPTVVHMFQVFSPTVVQNYPIFRTNAISVITRVTIVIFSESKNTPR